MEKNMIKGLVIIIVFSLIVTLLTTYFTYSLTENLDPEIMGTMTIDEVQIYLANFQKSMIYEIYLIPLLAFFGILAGIVSYDVMTKKESKPRDNKVVLEMLDKNEKFVVEKLVENDGKCQQIELSRLPNLNKVKTHRILNNLEQKGVIKREKYGKVNLIVLKKDLYTALKK